MRYGGLGRVTVLLAWVGDRILKNGPMDISVTTSPSMSLGDLVVVVVVVVW